MWPSGNDGCARHAAKAFGCSALRCLRCFLRITKKPLDISKKLFWKMPQKIGTHLMPTHLSSKIQGTVENAGKDGVGSNTFSRQCYG
jgi:hypothetical protein